MAEYKIAVKQAGGFSADYRVSGNYKNERTALLQALREEPGIIAEGVETTLTIRRVR